MIISGIVDALESNLQVFVALLENQDQDFIKWKQGPDKWCVLEVICHLIDEEKEDFRSRVLHLLKNPDTEPSPIDPEAWVEDSNLFQLNWKSFKRKESILFLYCEDLMIPIGIMVMITHFLGE